MLYKSLITCLSCREAPFPCLLNFQTCSFRCLMWYIDHQSMHVQSTSFNPSLVSPSPRWWQGCYQGCDNFVTTLSQPWQQINWWQIDIQQMLKWYECGQDIVNLQLNDISTLLQHGRPSSTGKSKMRYGDCTWWAMILVYMYVHELWQASKNVYLHVTEKMHKLSWKTSRTPLILNLNFPSVASFTF